MAFSRMRTFALGLLLVIIAAAVAAPARAQNLPATPHTPDLLGIYPGMANNAAQAQLQKHSDAVSVLSTPPSQFEMTIPATGDMVTAYLTLPPNDPPTVWMVQRSRTFDRNNVMSQDALMSGLRSKYGQETMTSDHGEGGLYVYWIFDKNGKLLATADKDLQGCSGSQFVTNMRNGPDHGSTVTDKCYSSFLAVTAYLNRGAGGMLAAYSVELVNLPYAVQAAKITKAVSDAAANKTKQDQINKANQNKPTF
jgi:hypothetical protein